MSGDTIGDRVREVAETFEAQTSNREELDRLRAFYDRMKRAGIATTREYDLPQLDTIGRNALLRSESETS
jgi:hypothetical protein